MYLFRLPLDPEQTARVDTRGQLLPFCRGRVETVGKGHPAEGWSEGLGVTSILSPERRWKDESCRLTHRPSDPPHRLSPGRAWRAGPDGRLQHLHQLKRLVSANWPAVVPELEVSFRPGHRDVR